MLPESLTLGTRTLEDVFLELTGRALARTASGGTFTPMPGAASLPRMVSPRRAWSPGSCCATASSC